MSDAVQIAQKLTLGKKAVVEEIMALQPGKSARVIGRRMARTGDFQARQSIFPGDPGQGKANLAGQIAAKQALMIGRDRIGMLAFGNGGQKMRPTIREKARRSAPVEPIQLSFHAQKDAAQHKSRHRLGVGLSIGKRQRCPPAATKQNSRANSQCGADGLDVCDQVLGGVGLDAGARARTSAATLIEKDAAVMIGVKKAAHERAATTARTTMQHDDRRPIGIATLLDVDLMTIAHINHALVVRVDLRMKPAMRRIAADLPCQSVHEVTIQCLARARHSKDGKMTSPQYQSSIDPAEVAKFQAMARDWWDPNGKFKPLHMLNPTRLDYVVTQIAAEFSLDLRADQPFAGLRILDIGCGGGLISEPLARLGAKVTGADAAPGNIAVASLHAQEQGLEIEYLNVTAESLASEGRQFDVVVALEIVEHVADPAAFVQTCHDLLRPGGLSVISTLNRTAKSFAVAILGAEWVMRWLPKGTHDWRRFITPDELSAMAGGAGFLVADRMGMVFNPLGWSWSLSPRDLSVNYAMTALRHG